MSIKLEGGGKALVAWPLVDELFLRLPLEDMYPKLWPPPASALCSFSGQKQNKKAIFFLFL